MFCRETCREESNRSPKHDTPKVNITIQKMKPDGLRARGTGAGSFKSSRHCRTSDWGHQAWTTVIARSYWRMREHWAQFQRARVGVSNEGIFETELMSLSDRPNPSSFLNIANLTNCPPYVLLDVWQSVLIVNLIGLRSTWEISKTHSILGSGSDRSILYVGGTIQ